MLADAKPAIKEKTMLQPADYATVAANADGRERMPGELSELLTVKAVARLLTCSPRQVYRLADAGKLPRPVRLGALVRWPRAAIMAWIGSGCGPCPKGGAK